MTDELLTTEGPITEIRATEEQPRDGLNPIFLGVSDAVTAAEFKYLITRFSEIREAAEPFLGNIGYPVTDRKWAEVYAHLVRADDRIGLLHYTMQRLGLVYHG